MIHRRSEFRKLLTVFAVLVLMVVVLPACAYFTSPPVSELVDAESAVAEARAAGAESCAPEKFKAAEEALEEGRYFLKGFNRERWAKQRLVEAKSLAMEAKVQCMGSGG